MIIPRKYPPLSGTYNGYRLTCRNCGWSDIYVIDSISGYAKDILKNIMHIPEICPQCGHRVDKQKTVFRS